MILLDTNAVIYLVTGHKLAKLLGPYSEQLAFSPIALLELRFLEEIGKGAIVGSNPEVDVHKDSRWTVDDPPLEGLVRRALPLNWTRDPFDRLLAAHALFRGWRLATSDSNLWHHLPGSTLILA